MATHSSILAWEIAWTEEPGRLLRVAKSQKQLATFIALDQPHKFPLTLSSFVIFFSAAKYSILYLQQYLAGEYELSENYVEGKEVKCRTIFTCRFTFIRKPGL